MIEDEEEMESFSRKSSAQRPPTGAELVKQRVNHWTNSMRNFIRRGLYNVGFASEATGSTLNLIPSEIGSESNNSRQPSSSSGYTELHGGSVPCPSCKGSGLIPKELESTLVALIPVNDERLKPRKTCIHITIWVVICILIGSGLLFVLMPRTVYLTSNRMPIEMVTVYSRDPEFIDFYFMNTVNISSGNYLPVSVTNITATITSRFQPWSTDVVGRGGNETLSQLGPLALYRNARELMFNNTVDLKGVVAEYCQASFSRFSSLYVNLQFDVAVTLQYYYGHQELISLTTEQQVCCVPSGNCTAT